MTLDDLRSLIDSGEFHHATYREIGTIWEGLWIYRHDPKGCRGFNLVDAFNHRNPDCKAAEEIVRHTGVSVGSYGNG